MTFLDTSHYIVSGQIILLTLGTLKSAGVPSLSHSHSRSHSCSVCLSL